MDIQDILMSSSAPSSPALSDELLLQEQKMMVDNQDDEEDDEDDDEDIEELNEEVLINPQWSTNKSPSMSQQKLDSPNIFLHSNNINLNSKLTIEVDKLSTLSNDDNNKGHNSTNSLSITNSLVSTNNNVIEQNMVCPLCKKIFRFEKNLLRHMQKTHATGEAESVLKCKLCNYTTRHYSNMYVHIRTHTGDKPYSCSGCGASFTQGSSLKLHIKSRHEDNTSLFSLTKKPGKNNLTKLWTRVYKKDLSKYSNYSGFLSGNPFGFPHPFHPYHPNPHTPALPAPNGPNNPHHHHHPLVTPFPALLHHHHHHHHYRYHPFSRFAAAAHHQFTSSLHHHHHQTRNLHHHHRHHLFHRGFQHNFHSLFHKLPFRTTTATVSNIIEEKNNLSLPLTKPTPVRTKNSVLSISEFLSDDTNPSSNTKIECTDDKINVVDTEYVDVDDKNKETFSTIIKTEMSIEKICNSDPSRKKSVQALLRGELSLPQMADLFLQLQTGSNIGINTLLKSLFSNTSSSFEPNLPTTPFKLPPISHLDPSLKSRTNSNLTMLPPIHSLTPPHGPTTIPLPPPPPSVLQPPPLHLQQPQSIPNTGGMVSSYQNLMKMLDKLPHHQTLSSQ